MINFTIEGQETNTGKPVFSLTYYAPVGTETVRRMMQISHDKGNNTVTLETFESGTRGCLARIGIDERLIGQIVYCLQQFQQ